MKATKPQPPEATWTNVKAIVGNELQLADRYSTAMFALARTVTTPSHEWLAWNSAMKLVWQYERIVRRNLRLRHWEWLPSERIALGDEVTNEARDSEETKALIKIEIDWRLNQVNTKHSIELNRTMFESNLIVIGNKSLLTKINTCRVVNDCVFLCPEMQKLAG